MLRKALILSITASLLLANNIATEQQNLDSQDKSIQKSFDKSKTREKSRQQSKEKGYEFSKNREVSKGKEREHSLSIEQSNSYSKSLSFKQTIEMPATLMMPEVDSLINNVLLKLISHDKDFIENFRNSFIKARKLIGKTKYYCDPIGNTFQREFLKYYFPSTRWAGGYKCMSIDKQGAVGSYHDIIFPDGRIEYQDKMLFRPYGDIVGRAFLEFPEEIFREFDLIFRNKGYLKYDFNSNTFLFSYKNIEVVKYSPNGILHFYGDLVFENNNQNNNVRVVDFKLNANKLHLDQPNAHKYFDEYLKKLMYLYYQAFKAIDTNKVYSADEIKFKVRKFIYEKVFNRSDFVERYLKSKTSFWRPRRLDLFEFPSVETGYNDIIYDKLQGFIFNKKIVFNVETSKSVQENFNRLLRDARTKKFALHIKKAVNQFMRENRQDLARLTMQLAKKVAMSKNATKKMDIVTKSSTSTDILKDLFQLVK
jgi:hypothetical protein